MRPQNGIRPQWSHLEVLESAGSQIEIACYLLAREAGVEMVRCRLHEGGGRAHFMTRRFDRNEHGGKVHMQSLCAMLDATLNK